MNKILVEVYVPLIEEKYEVLIPTNKSVHTVIQLLSKAIEELSDNSFKQTNTTRLYNQDNGISYAINSNIKDAGILNGSKVILF